MSALTATSFATLIAGVLLNTYNQVQIEAWLTANGAAQGQQLDVLASGVDAYITKNFRTLVGQTSGIVNASGSAAVVANQLKPTVTELSAMGYLQPNYNSVNYYAGGYRIDLSQVGTCPDTTGTGNCTIGGTVSTNSAILLRGQPNYSALNAAMKAVGADAGFSKVASPGTISGMNNGWSATNQVGSVAGVLAIRVGTDATRFNTAYRRDGALPLTAALNMGGQLIHGIGTATVGNACSNKGDWAQDGNGAPVYCTGTKWAAVGGANWITSYASLLATTCDSTAKGQIYTVITPTTGSGSRAYACNGSSWDALAVNDAGNLTVPGLLTTAGVNLTKVAVAGNPCNPAVDGNMALDPTGSPLYCQSGTGVWAQAGSSGSGLSGVFKPLAGKSISCSTSGSNFFGMVDVSGTPYVRTSVTAGASWLRCDSGWVKGFSSASCGSYSSTTVLNSVVGITGTDSGGGCSAYWPLN